MRKFLNVIQLLMVLMITTTAAIAEVTSMTPDVAREKALAGEIILIDIRRPEEWAAAGVPDAAILLDMTSPDFMSKIAAIRAQSPGTPLALTCQSGGRSGYLTREFDKIGLDGIIDVVGGFGGSNVDPGWQKRGLPVRAPTDPVNPQVSVTQP